MEPSNNDIIKKKKNKKVQLFKPRKKKYLEEDAAIKYLQSQYDKIDPGLIKTFKDFPLSQKTLKGLKENNYITPTEIQRQAIGYALQGKDILGAAKTGSGKTLAFLVPILESLFCKKWTRLDGVGALIISPTRELAYQIYETLRKIGSYHDFSAGLIIGGQNLKFERKRMDQINILICTPGRLLQHMDENPTFNYNNLQILILDEADRCLDMGFEATMNAIIENLPPARQTLLFSATQTKSVRDLSRLSLSFPTYVAPHEQAAIATPDSLQQNYVVCQVDEKLGILWSFIKNHLKQKVLVFMATCKQVKYTYELFCKLKPGVSLLALYGTLHQNRRENIYNEFCRKSNVVLFATDLASRGLDFPRVNWVIQYDCPEDVETYIHRVGRTARGVLGKGEGLLLLLPNEEELVEDLKMSKIPINKIFIDPSKVVVPQAKIESLLSDNTELKQTAQRAFVNYVKSVFLMKNKKIFNINLLDTDAYARSLGLTVPPLIKFLQKHKYSVKKQGNMVETNNIVDKLTTKTDVDECSDQSSAESDKDELIKLTKQRKVNVKKEISDLDFHKNDNSDCDDEFFQGERRDINLIGAMIDNVVEKKEQRKPLTKAAVAKKLLKKKIQLNTKVKFSEADEVVEGEDQNDEKDLTSKLTKQLGNEKGNRINISKVREIFPEEDKRNKIRFKEIVKAKHKEQKRKLKNKKKSEQHEKDDFGSQSESDGPDLSWLPDPDKIYGKKEGSGDSAHSDISACHSADEHVEMSNDELIENDKKLYRPLKRKLVVNKGIPQESVIPRKAKKIEDISKSLSVQEAEALAMQLLQNK